MESTVATCHALNAIGQSGCQEDKKRVCSLAFRESLLSGDSRHVEGLPGSSRENKRPETRTGDL